MIYSSAEIFGSKPAFLVKDVPGGKYRPISYIQLKEDINDLGTRLIDMGLKVKRSAVIGENSYKWVVTYLAVTNGTGVIVPLDKELTAIEIGNLLRAEADAVFFSAKMREEGHGRLWLKRISSVRRSVWMVMGGDGIVCWDQLLSEGKTLRENGDRDLWMPS